MTAISMPGNKIRNRIGMGMTPETAEWVSAWSNWFLLGSLIVGVVATFFLVVSNDVKETVLKRELAASRERIAELGKRQQRLTPALKKRSYSLSYCGRG